ncbi:glycosyltransferase [Agriterribacter sp.]|uniref:glycosyltransferase n=1 Tax=Agriterribacter sp. TaxID=2821509 RepID=UPI002C54069A|nr:glycosyltransferase [Agriterribacter sp.]HTN05645.1 glycosyltransferase [Agriterribacter sp.]
MKVIINGGKRFLPKEKNFEGFIHHIFCRLCQVHTTATFIFLSCDNSSSLPGNGLPVALPVPFLAKPVSKLWYNRKVASVIKKTGAGILITLNGQPISAPIHQMLVIADITDRKKIKAAVKYVDSGKRCSIITPSFLMKQKLVSEGIAEAAVFVLPQSPGLIYQPFNWEKREAIKNTHTEGREYLLMPLPAVPHHHMINTLKAFSQFKKWQQSNMRLVLAGSLTNNKKTRELLQTYRYRSDVLLMEEKLNEKAYAAILASCMAMIYLPGNEGTGIVLAEALQCGTPVITTATATLTAAGGDAVLYCDPADIKKLAGEMVKLYKDEKFRHTLTGKGVEQVSLHNEATVMHRLWNYIQQVVTA